MIVLKVYGHARAYAQAHAHALVHAQAQARVQAHVSAQTHDHLFLLMLTPGRKPTKVFKKF